MVKESALSRPQYKTIHEKNLEVPMRDGTILRANVTRPDAEGKFPVLLERTPYNKEGGSENSVGAPEFFASRGYAVVIVVYILIFGLIAVLGVACSSAEDDPATPVPAAAPTSASMIDFISFGGITYLTLRIEKEPPLQEENLGLEFGQVAFKYEGNVSDPSYKLRSGKDGDAAFLEVGTPVYTVKGYKPEFILAARRNNKLVLYMSDTHPNAETGSDLMDLEGKVKYIGVNSEKDGKTELAAIKDQSQVDSLVRMVLDAPVDQNIRNDLDSDLYFLAFHLKDGITVTRGYRLQSNLLDRGIKLPREFRTAIEDALR